MVQGRDLVPFSKHLMLNNTVTLKFRLGVTHPASSRTTCTSLKAMDPQLSSCC